MLLATPKVPNMNNLEWSSFFLKSHLMPEPLYTGRITKFNALMLLLMSKQLSLHFVYYTLRARVGIP